MKPALEHRGRRRAISSRCTSRSAARGTTARSMRRPSSISEGNRIRRRPSITSRGAHAGGRRVHPPDRSRLLRAAVRARPADGPIPIFLISMPRAGSTLLEQMLDQHPDIEAVGELPYIRALVRSAPSRFTRAAGRSRVPAAGRPATAPTRRALRRRIICTAPRCIAQRQPRYFVDKMPMNWSDVPFIRRHPPAGAVHRNPPQRDGLLLFQLHALFLARPRLVFLACTTSAAPMSTMCA